MCAFMYLQEVLGKQIQKPLLLFLDSDITLDRLAIAHFVYEITERNNCEALTGLITISSGGFLENLQNVEYIDSQVLHRGTESTLGGVSCLPGALAMLRFESLRLVSTEYFAQRPATTPFSYARRSLGEDRYLTELLLQSDPKPHRIGFAVAARCQTTGCETLSSLMKQRRRWFLGTVSNEVSGLTTWKLWKTLPRLQLLQLMLSVRNAPLFLYLAIAEIALGEHNQLMWLSIGGLAAIQIPIWITVTYVGITTGRGILPALYFPLYAALLPLAGFAFEIYGIMTFRRRSWGGPRADNENGAAYAADDEFSLEADSVGIRV